MTGDPLPLLVEMFSELGRDVDAATPVRRYLQAVVEAAGRLSVEAPSASIVRRGTKHITSAATSDRTAAAADRLQIRMRVGPTIDATEPGTPLVRLDDVTDQPPQTRAFGSLLQQLDVRSALAIRLSLGTDADIAVLTFYARGSHAFDDTTSTVALLFAQHASALIAHRLAVDKSANLMIALESSREIGVAMGVLMQRQKVTQEEAFAMLHAASQRTHRKLRQVAAGVAETGTLEDRGGPSDRDAGRTVEGEVVAPTSQVGVDRC